MRTRALNLLPLAWLGLIGALPVAGCSDGDSTRDPVEGGAGEGVGASGGAGGVEAEGGAAGNESAGAGSDAGGRDQGGAGGESGAAGADGGSAGAPSGCGVVSVGALEAGVWDRRFTISGMTGHDGITPSVYDFAFEPDGGVLATGRFAYHEDRAVPPLVRLKDGKWEAAHETWTLEPTGDGFAALARRDDGALALATADSFGERDGEIWLDQAGEQRVIGSFSGQVRTLVWFEDKLYVAGAFELAAGDGDVAHLAVWDGVEWTAPLGGPADGPVLELLIDDGSLYVGGSFGEVGGVVATNVASFDGATWVPLSLEQALAVYALARTDAGELYAGGALGELDAASGVMKRVGDIWEIVGGGLAQFQTRGVVSDLVAHDGVVDVAGCFSSAGGFAGSAGSVTAVGLARWDGAAWHGLNDGGGAASPWFQPGVCGDEGLGALWDMEYQRLGYAGGKLFVGGSFAGVGGVQTQSLAVLEDGDWVPQGESGLGIGGSLDRLATGGPSCELYGLGAFTHLAGKQSSGRVARFTGSGWQLLSDELPSDAYCPALDVSRSGELVVGCMIFTDDGGVRGALLHPSGDELVELELGASLLPVHAVKWDSAGKLWIGGGDAGGFLATVEGDELDVIDDELDGVVQFIDVRAGDDVIVAGMFANVGGLPAARIAHYAAGEWTALGDGLLGQPQAIARDGERVYASTYDDGSGAFLLGAFDGESWSELAGGSSGLAVEDFCSFNQLLPVEGGLVVVGSAELTDGSGRGALVWRDGVFEALAGGGVHAISASGVAVGEDALWIGGVIAEASNGGDPISTVGVARLAL
jgi:hypothetical protein